MLCSTCDYKKADRDKLTTQNAMDLSAAFNAESKKLFRLLHKYRPSNILIICNAGVSSADKTAEQKVSREHLLVLV